MLPDGLSLLLDRLKPDLDAVAGPWTLIGSGALVLLGLPLEVMNYLDIVTNAEGAGRLRTLWSDWLGPDGPGDSDGPFRSDDFAHYDTPWGPGEVIGDLKVRDEPLVIAAYHAVFPIPTAQEQLRILRLFGRPMDLDKSAQLEAWLSPG